MPNDYPRSIEPVIAIVLGCITWKSGQAHEVTVKEGRSTAIISRGDCMLNCSESLRRGRAARCSVCDGKFGLVRYYSWRTALCSKKCVDRFRARRTSDSSWLLHFCRVAICSTLVAEPETISSSQRRPRTIALTRRARRSMRVERTSFRGTPSGMRICRDFLDGGFCQGIDSN